MYNVTLFFTEQVLSSSPNQDDIFREYIASRSPDAMSIEEEVAAIGVDAVEEKGITVFPRTEDGKPFAYDYQIRGFFKESFGALNRAYKRGKYAGGKACGALKAFKKVTDQMVFVKPRQNVFNPPEGADVEFCVRPLRADTPQGAIVALAKSEALPAGTTLSFELILLDESLIDCIVEALEYGTLHGYGQWRNSGKGTFEYEVRKDGEVVYTNR